MKPGDLVRLKCEPLGKGTPRYKACKENIGIFLEHPVWGGERTFRWATVYFPGLEVRDAYLTRELEVISEG